VPKLSTEVARELFLYGPAGGKRITCVKELVRLSGAAERTIHAHMPQWKIQSAELAASGRETGLAITLSTSALESHKKDVEFMRSEVDRLKIHLRSLSPSDETYCAVSRALIATERQWLAFSGVGAMLEAAACAMKETAKLKAKSESAGKPAEIEEAVDGINLGFKRRS
jgi:hypothetical protein